MANTIILKEGDGTPDNAGDGVRSEPLYDYTNHKLYISDDNDEVPKEVGSTTYLPLAGGTLSGNVDVDNYDLNDIGRINFNTGGTFSGFYDEANMASNSGTGAASQSSIKAYVDASPNYTQYIRHIMHCGWVVSNANIIFMPLNGYIIDKPSTPYNNEYIAFVAPYDGFVEKVVVRSENACGNRCTVGFHKSDEGTEVPNTTATETIEVDMPTDDTGYTFGFSTAASFDKGDILAMSFKPASSSGDTVATIVWKFDTTT